MIEYENLIHSNAAYIADFEQAAARVIRSGRYILGSEVESFESEFASYVGAKYCVGVANGLEALTLSFEALELPKASHILVASNTYIATIIAIVRAGHQPILVEPDLGTFNINPQNIVSALTPQTRAICVTHLFGKPCRMDIISGIAAENGLMIIEDCAQSHGAKIDGKMTGIFGVAGCFSFYPTKNLGGIGDGGAITTDDSGVAERLRSLRNYGSVERYRNEYLGFNSRLDEIQAAFLRVKLEHLERITQHKRALANIYFSALPDWLNLPERREGEYEVFHIFGVRLSRRDELREWLFKKGIGTDIHYPVPPHRQKAMRGILSGEYPIADELHQTELSLPISIGHTQQDIARVCDAITSFN